MDVHEVLVAARNLIDREGWFKLGPDTRREGSHPRCALIAVRDANEKGSMSPVCDALRRVVGDEVDFWNDAPGRTKEEVLAAFDKAIAATAPEPYVHLEAPEEVAV